MVGRSTGVERLVCFRWFHSLVEVEGPVVDTRAGCSRWLQVKELLQTRGLVVLEVTSSGTGYAVHALKDNSVFYFTKRGVLDSCGTGCPQMVQFWNCFCRRGGWLPCSGLGQRNLFQTRGPVALSGQDEELLQTRGLVALQWSRVPGAFVDTGAGCSAVVSGSRGFCRHGGRLPCSGLGLQEH